MKFLFFLIAAIVFHYHYLIKLQQEHKISLCYCKFCSPICSRTNTICKLRSLLVEFQDFSKNYSGILTILLFHILAFPSAGVLPALNDSEFVAVASASSLQYYHILQIFFHNYYYILLNYTLPSQHQDTLHYLLGYDLCSQWMVHNF